MTSREGNAVARILGGDVGGSRRPNRGIARPALWRVAGCSSETLTPADGGGVSHMRKSKRTSTAASKGPCAKHSTGGQRHASRTQAQPAAFRVNGGDHSEKNEKQHTDEWIEGRYAQRGEYPSRRHPPRITLCHSQPMAGYCRRSLWNCVMRWARADRHECKKHRNDNISNDNGNLPSRILFLDPRDLASKGPPVSSPLPG